MSYFYIPPSCGGHGDGLSLGEKRELFRITLDDFKSNTGFMNGTDLFSFDYGQYGSITTNKRYVIEFLGETKPLGIIRDNFGYSSFANFQIEVSYWWGLSFTIYNPSNADISEIITTDLVVYEFEPSQTLDNNLLSTDLVIINSISTTSRMGANGTNSTALGTYTEASGGSSHAEGFTTVASGNNAHAEGRSTVASGGDSHAEGYWNTASGEQSHAQGSGTLASGNCSHAEGEFTKANGEYSHAEGTYTEANGRASHVEGEYTKASSENQHVQGKFNIEDKANKYAHIVGNGKKGKWNSTLGQYDNTYSNAHTLDWNGNGWYKGDVYVGGTSQDDGKKLLSTSDIYFDTDGNLVITINGVSKKFAPIE